MAFVNERFTQEDKEKLNIDSLLDYFRRGLSHWTADHEREMYLMCVDNGMGPDGASGEMEWIFIWHGYKLWLRTIYVDSKYNEDIESPKDNYWIRKKIDWLRIYDDTLQKDRLKSFPVEMNDKRDDIFKDLKEAMTMYREAGIFSTTKKYDVSLDIELGGGYVAHL